MHITSLEGGLKNFGSDASIMATITRGKIKGLIAEVAPRIYALPTLAEVQTRIMETIANMLCLCSAGSNGSKTAFRRFLESTVIKLLRCRAAEKVFKDCLERWSKSDLLLNSIVNQVVSTLLIWSTKLIKQHVDLNNDKCCMA